MTLADVLAAALDSGLLWLAVTVAWLGYLRLDRVATRRRELRDRQRHWR